MATDATSAVASVWPMAAITPARVAALISSAAPGSSGATVTTRRYPRGRRPETLEDANIGSEHMPRILSTAPDRGQERPLEVEPGQDAVGGQAGQHGRAGFQLGQRGGHQAGQHGGGAVTAVERHRAPGIA